MARLIAYTRPDGGVTILRPCVSQSDPAGFTLDDAFARALSRDIPANATNVKEIRDADLPADRPYRNSWVQSGATIAIDMPKARNIHREILRKKRDPKLVTLDVEYQKALDDGNVARQQQVATQRQALRDVTALPSIDAAQDIAALKAIRPAILE